MPAADRLFLDPAARRQALIDAIAGARRRLILSLFRCNDAGVLGALDDARRRGVRVEAILTRRAKGGRKKLRRLWRALDELGVAVHVFADRQVKYHAKYLVADEELALVATLNPTKKCFTRTWDFVLTTGDPRVVQSLSTLFLLDTAGRRLHRRHRLSPRLIVGPDSARARLRAIIAGARHSIRVLDHKLSDDEMVALLRAKRSAGVAVSVIGRQPIDGYLPHGKLLIIDGAQAVLGSTALSAPSLDRSREVSIVSESPSVVSALTGFYRELSAHVGSAITRLPGDRAA